MYTNCSQALITDGVDLNSTELALLRIKSSEDWGSLGR